MVNSSEQSLQSLTEKLLHLNNEAFKQYVERTKSEGYETDFYHDVKPFADEVLAVAKQWKEAALDWLKEEKVKYLYPVQIENAYDNLLIISVKAFQKDTRSKRFNEMIKSIDYILNTMLAQLK